MGKNGEALRAAKVQKTTYTFTREQLEARDRALLKDYRERCAEKLEAQLQAEREAQMAENLQYLLALSCRALHKAFGIQGLPKIRKAHPRSRMVKFVNCVIEEANTVLDIQEYCAMVYDQLGVIFKYGEEEEEEEHE